MDKKTKKIIIILSIILGIPTLTLITFLIIYIGHVLGWFVF